ncbi:MFS transporter [Phytohabitans kaempferiae]|uniref:MFS transporter n=1 Tax=Phytohabitans kaempferiae TaxID=1620943 RepID=A0ABV6MB83_9ACTN
MVDPSRASASGPAHDPPEPAPPVPLRRNRNYLILLTGQTISEFGSAVSTVALPLLVLVLTGSAIQAGFVAFANMAARFLFGIVAGALVDRWNRHRIMLVCEGGRAAAMGTLATALLLGNPPLTLIIVAVVVEGAFAALFAPSEEAAMPSVVPPEQLPNAMAAMAGRAYLGVTVGPAAGGFLFQLKHTVPFLVDAISYAFSFFLLFFLRLPRRVVAAARPKEILGEIGAGLRWVLGEPRIRVSFLSAVALNLVFNALLFTVILVASERKVPASEIGIMTAMLGVGGLAGAFLAPQFQSRMRPHTTVIALAWICTLLTPLLVFVPAGIGFGLVMAAMAFPTPAATTSIQAAQLLLTPDGLRGRLSGATQLSGGVSGALGPLTAGFLVNLTSDGMAFLICAGALLLISLSVTFSPSLRSLPDLAKDAAGGEVPRERDPAAV